MLFILYGCSNKDKYSQGLIFEYIKENDAYKVIGYEGKDTKLIIPSKYDKKPVIALGFKTLPNDIVFKEIILPNSIETIAANTFNTYQFSELKKLVIPTNCKYLALAFNNTSNIDIVVPLNHRYLKEVKVDGNIVIMTKEEDEIVYISKALSQDVVLTIPSTVKKISDHAAAYTNYYKINLPDGLLYIGERAFINTFCFRVDQLPTIINIPDSVEYIGSCAFQGSISSEKLKLPKNLKKVETMAFVYNNINLIIIYDKLESFSYLFNGVFPSEKNNKILNIKFAGLNMNIEAKSNFIENFFKTNFIDDWYDGKEINIEIDYTSNREEIVNLIEESFNIYKLAFPDKEHVK